MGIGENNHVAGGMACAEVAGARDAEAMFGSTDEVDALAAIEKLGGFVFGGVIDNNDFRCSGQCGFQIVDGCAQVFAFIAGDDDDSNGRHLQVWAATSAALILGGLGPTA